MGFCPDWKLDKEQSIPSWDFHQAESGPSSWDHMDVEMWSPCRKTWCQVGIEAESAVGEAEMAVKAAKG